MSLAAHGPRLIDAFLKLNTDKKLKTDKLRGAVADLAKALATNARQYGPRRMRAALTAKPRR
jgi:hypothetical protein